ncbi:MAG TPA: hypothetical protein VGF79_08410 [Bacteroidia bacterium]
MQYQNNPAINIKRNLFTAFIALLLMSLPFNQAFGLDNGKKGKAKREKIEELRKKFYNEKLSLSETEQKGFWPLFTEYKQKEKALRDSFRAKYKPNDVVFMDDKQAEEFLNATIKLNEDQNNLFKEYVTKFKKVISVKKVAMLPMIEREFKKQILKQAREHHKPGGPDGEPAPPEED